MNNFLLVKYTKVDFYNWIEKGLSNGLDDKIISKNRAIAQMNNPDACDADILLTAIFIHDINIGYRGVFPEIIEIDQKTIKIAITSTFFVHPDYRGQGIASKLMKPIIDNYKNGVFGLNSSINLMNVYRKLHWKSTHIKKYTIYFQIPKIKRNLFTKSISILSPILNKAINYHQKNILKKSSREKFNIEYLDYINARTYSFIKQTNISSFNKNKAKYNWILKYGWGTHAPCLNRTDDNYYFTSVLKHFEQNCVQVKFENRLIGLFIYRLKNDEISIPFIFSEKKLSHKVYTSILEHIIQSKATFLSSVNKELISFLKDNTLVLKELEKDYSLSSTFLFPIKLQHINIQDGDGDNFF